MVARVRDDAAVDDEEKALAPQRIGARGDISPRGRGSVHSEEDSSPGHFEIEEGARDEQSAGSKDPRITQRLYKVWPSQNHFFCGGLLLTGGSEECFAPNICVWTCILVPSALFFVKVLPSLWRREAYALPVAVCAVFLVTSGLLLLTCCTDPGIIPRREVILATGRAAELEAALGYDVLGGRAGGTGLEPAISETLQQQGYRWCRTCRIVRPPRASHCPDCDNCVLRYDHHCPFVNNCVGQRNYRYFFGFITSVLVLALLVIPSVLTYFSALSPEVTMKQMSKVSSTMWVFFWALALGSMLIIIAALMSFLLWAYHVYLITTKKTTKEYRKSIPNVTEEPTLCAERGPRLFDPRDLVDPADLKIQENSGSSRPVWS